MTADDQASQGRKVSVFGVFLFLTGFICFKPVWSGGIFTLHPLNYFPASWRADIVIGAILAAYGTLVWRRAFHDLSVANYIIVSSCVPILLVCVSKLSEWVYVLNQQNRYAPGVVIKIVMPVCIFAFAAGWADSTYLRERFHDFIGSGGSISGAAAGIFLCLALVFLSLIDSSSDLRFIGLYAMSSGLSVHLAGKLWRRYRNRQENGATMNK